MHVHIYISFPYSIYNIYIYVYTHRADTVTPSRPLYVYTYYTASWSLQVCGQQGISVFVWFEAALPMGSKCRGILLTLRSTKVLEDICFGLFGSVLQY